jgi:hypothetical protein
LGSRDKRIAVPGQPGQNVGEILSQKPSQVWWLMSVIPATQEAEVGGMQTKASPVQKHNPLPERLSKTKRAGYGSRGRAPA